MKTYLLNLWDAARASYWFVPSLFAVAALCFSFVLPLVDQTLAASSVELPEWIRTTTDTARATLSATAGAMIAVTGTVFSITVVTLSLTSQQFGPRLLRRFMYDLTTQITLGVFLSTGVYCLLLLRSVEAQQVVPHLSILCAVALAGLSMAMLIVFIHHIAMLIQAPQVVAAVARDLDDAIVRLFPEKIGEPASDRSRTDGDEQQVELGENCVVVRSTREGYIQAIDGEGLMHVAGDQQLIVRIRSRPGDFISIGTPLADVWPSKQQAVERLDSEDLVEQLNSMIIVGVRRTPRQDVECAIDELVEVAVRSLSPGINDPFTAINCIDRLGAALGRLSERDLPSACRYDDDDRLRVITRPVSFPDVLDAAFNQIRQYGRDSVAVVIRLLETLDSIANHLQRDADREAVQRHAEMILRATETWSERHDQEQVRQRVDRVTTTLAATE